MDILREFRQWVTAHWDMLEAEGIRIALGGQTPQQTVKTNQLSLFADNERFEAGVILWEFGHCNVEIVDMEGDVSLPLEECVEVWFYEGLTSREALNAAMESILEAFRTRSQLTGNTPPPD